MVFRAIENLINSILFVLTFTWRVTRQVTTFYRNE